MKTNFALWRSEFRAAVIQRIRALDHDGTTSMSRDNLFQIVRIPPNGGPTGTNARWVARQVFDEIVARLPDRLRDAVK